MFKFNIDIKTIIIVLLGLIIIFMFLFRPSKDISMYEEEINILNQRNKILIEINDSITNLNNLLGNQIILLEKDVETVNGKLTVNEKEINKLKRNKGEIYKHVNSLDVNGVTRGFSDYLKRKH